MTALQKRVYELRESEDPPLSFPKIGKLLKRGPGSCYQAYRAAQKKVEAAYAPPPVQSNALEVAQPARAAEVIDTLTDPHLQSIARAARECGLPQATTSELMKRLQTVYSPVVRAIEDVKTHELERLLGDRAKRVLDSIGDTDIQNATLAQKAVAIGIMVQRRNELARVPAERVSTEERKTLDELVPMIAQVLKERGITMERVADGSFVPAEDTVDLGS